MATLAEILEKIKEALENAQGAAGGQSPPNKTAAAGYLNDAEDDIDVILDPGQSPSLSPATAGSVLPQTQHGNYDDCIDYQISLADDAVTEAKDGNDQDYIGDRIKTIKDHLEETRDLLDSA